MRLRREGTDERGLDARREGAAEPAFELAVEREVRRRLALRGAALGAGASGALALGAFAVGATSVERLRVRRIDWTDGEPPADVRRPAARP